MHEWSYVRGLQRACAGLPEEASAVGSLDADTAISAGTFRAALVAAGAVCRAVDRVMAGEVRETRNRGKMQGLGRLGFSVLRG